MAVAVLIDFHWLRGEWVKGEPPVALLQAVGDGAAFQAPFAHEGVAPRFALGPRRGVDHIAIVVGDFLVQTLWRASEEIAVLVNVMPMSA
jgi:hypothetical protein